MQKWLDKFKMTGFINLKSEQMITDYTKLNLTLTHIVYCVHFFLIYSFKKCVFIFFKYILLFYLYPFLLNFLKCFFFNFL